MHLYKWFGYFLAGYFVFGIVIMAWLMIKERNEKKDAKSIYFFIPVLYGVMYLASNWVRWRNFKEYRRGKIPKQKKAR